jgi:signal transduction histidine kinase
MTDFDEPETEEGLREIISSVAHDLNNPLSIIAGNAQFLVELSQEEDLDDQFRSSARDIREASRQMSESLQRLIRLKERLEDESQ